MELRKFILPALLASASIAGFVAPAQAQAQAPVGQAQTVTVNIPAGELGSALQLFARQADVEVIFSASELSGLRTPGVSGRLSPREALARLLRGTGLSLMQDSSGAFLVRSAQSAEAVQQTEAPVDAGEEQAIVVTGTRIPGVDVAAPTITIARDEIEQTGYSKVEDLFEDLPQNFDEVTPEGRFANEGGSLLRGQNSERATAVDLRGLGAQSTLTLVNGNRRAGSVGGRVVDISVIPLAAIERVEVVTGGRSAVYGADAVAGVVNLVTRRDFEGVESQGYFGFAEDGGGERLQLSQIGGIDTDRGGFVVAYDFSRDWQLELGDAGLLSGEINPEIGVLQVSANAQADTWRHSLFGSGRYNVTDRLEVYADGLYSHKTFEDLQERFFEGAADNSTTDTRNVGEHYSLSGGARVAVGSEWSLNLAASRSVAENRSDNELFLDVFGLFIIEREFREDSEATMTTASAVAEGPLFAVGNIVPRAAFGVEWRREGFERNFDGSEEFDDDRTVRSAFGEIVIPFEYGGSAARSFEVSLAARYDDYSDFGGTFNPQIGVTWEPFNGLKLRGAYSSAFRAPALIDSQPFQNSFLELSRDPMQGAALVPVLFTQGVVADLGPEEADTWSVGVDYRPSFASWLSTSLYYIDIKYDGRIEQPSVNADRELVLERADRFPGLINRMPTSAEVAALLAADQDDFIDNDTGVPFDPATQDILDVFPGLILFNNLVGNVAVETLKALDANVDAVFDTEIGKLNFGVNATYTIEHDRQVTAESPAFSLLNEVGKPVGLRARGQAGWTRGAYGAFAYVNYVDSYDNPFSVPPSRIEPWTTVDLTLRFDGSKLDTDGFLNGFTATASVDNLFDATPPRFNESLQGLLYDATNANAFGRFFSLRLTKRW